VILGTLLTLLVAWLAGAAANWAADVLPSLGKASPVAGQAGGWLYYLSAGAWRHATAGAEARRAWRGRLLHTGMVAAFLYAGWRLQGHAFLLAIAWAYSAFLLTVLVIDFEHRRVLNVMLAPAAVAALLLSSVPGMPGISAALLGGALGLGVFGLLGIAGRGRLMGAGDVKLAGLIGLMLGYPAVTTALLAGTMLGGLAAVGLLVTRRAGRKSYMAYAPYLALGAIIILPRLLGE
jgi:leader peptidase (prepilin peptidase) / N-methyltransferase